MVRNKNAKLIFLSVAVALCIAIIGVPKARLRPPKGIPVLAITDIGRLDSVTYSAGQFLVISDQGEGKYSPKMFSARNPEKPENVEYLVKVAKAVVDLRGEVSVSGNLKVIRNQKAFWKHPEKSEFFTIDSQGKLSYGIGDIKNSTLLVNLPPEYFENTSLIEKLSKAKHIAEKNKDGTLSVNTQLLTDLALDRVYITFDQITGEQNETGKTSASLRVTELVPEYKPVKQRLEKPSSGPIPSSSGPTRESSPSRQSNLVTGSSEQDRSLPIIGHYSSSSGRSSLSTRSTSYSSQISSSAASSKNSCRCPYKFIVIGGQGGTKDHPIFKDLASVLPGAEQVPLNPGGGMPDDRQGAIDKAQKAVNANKENGFKTLVVSFSMGGALAINEFANDACVEVYSIDPPVHMNGLVCNDFYGWFDSRCKMLENAEDCLKTNPSNVTCYWCTDGKCTPKEDHDPFTYKNQKRIDEITAQLAVLKKACEP